MIPGENETEERLRVMRRDLQYRRLLEDLKRKIRSEYLKLESEKMILAQRIHRLKRRADREVGRIQKEQLGR